MSVLVAIFGLAFLILVHEAGHFVTALAVGMRPRSFNLGFGPPLLKIRIRGIDYAVRGIPLGGYVKIPGMHRPAASDVDAYFGRGLRDAPELVGPAERLKRSLETGDLGQAEAGLADLQAAAERTGAGSLAERGLRELSDGLGRDAYWRQRTWRKVAVILAGPGTNALLAVLLFWIVFMTAIGKVTSRIDAVLPDRPAAAVGLLAGDRIVQIDGRHVDAIDIPNRISSSKGRPLILTVERSGSRVELGPVRALEDDDGRYRLGFRLGAEPLGAGESALESLDLTWAVTRETVKSLGRIVHEEGREQISSPVGIVRESSRAADEGVERVLGIFGFISLSLALLNLLPLLPLDGGHIAFSLIEGIRGRAVAREVYERVSAIGIAVVLLLFFVGLSNDVGRLDGG